MAERKTFHTYTPNGWVEWFEPTSDPDEWRRLAELHPMTEQERLAASLRYALAEYDRGRAARARRRP